MGLIERIAAVIPEVAQPTEKRLGFKKKMIWTLVVLVAFFILGTIPLWGLDPTSQFQFAQLELILGASFGSLISLGIGPIVTSSIVLQLLNGAGLIKFDTRSPEGKTKFQALQKVMALFFVVFESFIYVFMGGLSPVASAPNFQVMQFVLVFQLMLGGLLIMFMDETISKWGFGSGISLFIAAGVGKEIFIRALSPFPADATGATGALFCGGQNACVGQIWEVLRLMMLGPEFIDGALIAISAIVATIAVFLVVVFTQAMKVEIPLSFGRVRGHGIRWPLQFFYTSNIPVILVAALLANVQLWARLMESWAGRAGPESFVAMISGWLGTYGGGQSPTGGFVQYITPPNLLNGVINASINLDVIISAIVYTLFMVVGSVIFAYFWVQTAGLDSKSQAKNIMASGLQVPGFRKDPRVMERLLDRYVMPLTVMGGIAIGLLAALADLTGTLTSGTGLLLAVMIIYKLYEDIAREQVSEMNPMVRKFLGK